MSPSANSPGRSGISGRLVECHHWLLGTERRLNSHEMTACADQMVFDMGKVVRFLPLLVATIFQDFRYPGIILRCLPTIFIEDHGRIPIP